MYYLGIDVGTVFTKATLVEGNEIRKNLIKPSLNDYRKACLSILEDVSRYVGNPDEISITVLTGYELEDLKIDFVYANDISCVARGAKFLFPNVKTVIEIGSQMSKVIRVGEMGEVASFSVGDRCAGGSGRFLQIIAKVLGVRWEDLSKLSLSSKNPVTFSTGCAVFTETEAISRIAEGALPEDIVLGVHMSVAKKVLNLAQRVGVEDDVVICGGGGRDIGLVKCIEKMINKTILVPMDPILCSSVGAAVLAKELY